MEFYRCPGCLQADSFWSEDVLSSVSRWHWWWRYWRWSWGCWVTSFQVSFVCISSHWFLLQDKSCKRDPFVWLDILSSMQQRFNILCILPHYTPKGWSKKSHQTFNLLISLLSFSLKSIKSPIQAYYSILR